MSKHQKNSCKSSSLIDQTLVDLFERQLEQEPLKAAVQELDSYLTYRDLDKASSALSALLTLKYGLQHQDRVLVYMDNSAHYLVTILGILKVGGIFVPIDTQQPEERIRFILKDTQAIAWITTRKHETKLRDLLKRNGQMCPDNIIIVDEQVAQVTKGTVKASHGIHPDDLAYIMYTSGTSGKPKGVMISHRAAVNYTANLGMHVRISKEDIVDFSTSIGFDLTVTTTLSSLCLGATIVPYEDLLENIEAYKNHLLSNGITAVKMVPSYAELFISFFPDTRINEIILGGEKPSAHLLNALQKAYARKGVYPLLWDEYGPTETTVGVYLRKIDLKDLSSKGVIYKNIKFYVLDDALKEVPIGAVGELFVGGASLARGYWNQEALTERKFFSFIPEDYSSQKKSVRIYRTGDLVRKLSEQEIDYVGRNDSQIKIHGFRIEPEEIENVLQAHEDVTRAVVLSKTNPNLKQSSHTLVAYMLPSEFKPSIPALQAFLKERLPDYMIPHQFIWIDSIPLTLNGKIDVDALPAPLFSTETFKKPRNQPEEDVLHIWSEVLGLSAENVGIDDGFLKLGGDSILAIQLVHQLRKNGKLRVTVRDIFEHKTIEALCQKCAVHAPTHQPVLSLSQETKKGGGFVPLLPIQEWFFSLSLKNPTHWNQAFLIKTPELDLHRLKACIKKLHEQHGAFHFRYKKRTEEAGSLYDQYYCDCASPPEIKILNIKSLNSKEGSPSFEDALQSFLTTCQTDFNLENGPTYCIAYVYGFSDQRAYIHFSAHHLIIDAVSWRIITEDLRDLYNGQETLQEVSDYGQWVRTLQDSALEHKGEKLYWLEILRYAEQTNMSLIPHLSKNKTCCSGSFTISKQATESLLRGIHKDQDTRINDVLLTAFNQALSGLTGLKQNCFLVEGHGREELNGEIDVSRTIGWFTSLYPVLLDAQDTLRASFQKAQSCLRALPQNGVRFGALFGYTHAQMPGICFNYLGQFSNQIKAQWSIISGSPGLQISRSNGHYNLLDVTGKVMDGILYFEFKTQLTRASLKRFSESFLKNLLDMIALFDERLDIVKNKEITREYLESAKEYVTSRSYPANNMQKGFLYHHVNKEEGDDAYVVQILWSYNTSLNVCKLREAWVYAIQRFSALRVRFDIDALRQIVEEEGWLDWRYIDLSLRKTTIESIQKRDREESFDLRKGSLLRVYLIQETADTYTCLFSHHHIILDGWSINKLLAYVHDIYLLLKEGKIPLQEKEQGYGEIQEYLHNPPNQNNGYWADRLATAWDRPHIGVLSRDESPDLHTRTAFKCLQKRTVSLESDLYSLLKERSRADDITVQNVILYAWHKILSIYTNAPNTIIGVTVSGRDIPIDGIEEAVGLFIHTVPTVVNHVAPQLTFVDLIRKLQSDLNEDSNINLASLQKGQGRLFDILYVYENYGNPFNDPRHQELHLVFQKEIEKLDYPLGLVVREAGDKLEIDVTYADDLFESFLFDSISETLQIILRTVVSDSKRMGGMISYGLPLDHQTTHQNISKRSQKTLADVFEDEIKGREQKTALVYQDESYTYEALNEKANQLANYLRKEPTQKDFVMLFFEKSAYTVISILGVLKSGKAYVPVDPQLPHERVRHIFDDTDPQIIITSKKHAPKIRKICGSRRVILTYDDAEGQTLLSTQTSVNPLRQSTSQDLAYVIYTSGTTGTPKGVMVAHEGIVNLCTELTQLYKINCSNSNEHFLLLADYSFDASVEQMFLSLLNGGTLFIPKKDLLFDTVAFCAYLRQSQITHIHATPLLLVQHDLRSVDTLKRVISGGDHLSSHLFQAMRVPDHVNFINEYGPTETSVTSLVKIINDSRVSIGFPLSYTHTYVLDTHLKVVPIGAVGELCIGGVGVAKGYLNLPKLTAEKFVSDPFNTDPLGEKKLYRTGDLVQKLPNGEFVFKGRNDFQVKMRGYRIELGEIESTLMQHPKIKQCVAIVQESSGNISPQNLVVFYVADSLLSASQILKFLSRKLPEYMHPHQCVQLTEFPLTVTGKIDRNALQVPALDSESNSLPRDTCEQEILDILADVLGLSKGQVGREDDFFKLGGDSIVSIQLIGRLRQRMGLQVRIKDVFQLRTVEKIYDQILKGTIPRHSNAEMQLTKPTNMKPSFDAHPGQDIVWSGDANSLQESFIYHHLSKNDNANTDLVQLTWQYHEVVFADILEKAWHHAQQTYFCLRLNLIWEGGDLLQTVRRVGKLDWRFKDLSTEANLEKQVRVIKKIQRDDSKEPYDLEKGSLFRVYLIKQTETLFTVLFSQHHLILDGWSTPLLLDHIHQTYAQLLTAESIDDQTEDPYIRVQEYIQNASVENEDYWKTYVQALDEKSTLNGLIDRPHSYTAGYNCIRNPGEQRIIVSDSLYRDLKAFSRTWGVTLNAIVQFVWHGTLYQHGDGKQTVVGTVVSGRHLPIDDIEKAVGLYINTLPLIVDHSKHKNKTIGEMIQEIQNQVNEMNSRSSVRLSRLQKGGERLFDTLMIYENYPSSKKASRQDGLMTGPIKSMEQIDHPLELVVYETCEKLILKLGYDRDLFSENRIKEILSVTYRLLTEASNSPDKFVQEILHKKFERSDMHKRTIDKKTFQVSSKKQTNPHPSHLENQILETMCHLLGVSKKQFGIEEDFFCAGGNSILSVKFVSQLKQKLGVVVTVRDVYQLRTVRALSAHIEKNVINGTSDRVTNV